MNLEGSCDGDEIIPGTRMDPGASLEKGIHLLPSLRALTHWPPSLMWVSPPHGQCHGNSIHCLCSKEPPLTPATRRVSSLDPATLLCLYPTSLTKIISFSMAWGAHHGPTDEKSANPKYLKEWCYIMVGKKSNLHPNLRHWLNGNSNFI